MIFDPDATGGRHGLDRLERAHAAWLTTVTADGQPQTMPVWFTWDGEEIVVYSDHRAKRNRNLEANPRVAVLLADADQGDDFVTIEGTARFDPDYPSAGDNARYMAKYGESINRHFGGPAKFSQTYSLPVRITLTRGRAIGG